MAAWAEVASSDSGCALRAGRAAKPHLACLLYCFACFIYLFHFFLLTERP